MNTYQVRYLSGPQHHLCYGPEEMVRAGSLAEALALKSPWPVERDMEQTFAWAKNPGTSLYYVEAWEARLVADQAGGQG
jgi:hypothetical protein